MKEVVGSIWVEWVDLLTAELHNNEGGVGSL